jgi:hypothetical protein
MAPSGAVDNTAIGSNALSANTAGSANTAIGQSTLVHITLGDNNIALGNSSGANLTTGNDNIYIGNEGVAANPEATPAPIPEDSGVIRIGTNLQTATFIAGIYGNVIETGLVVTIDPTTGQLGTQTAAPGRPSFGQLEQDMKTMDTAIAQQRDEFKALVAEQRKSIETLTAKVKAQDDQLQRVTVRMEQNRVTPKTVANRK